MFPFEDYMSQQMKQTSNETCLRYFLKWQKSLDLLRGKPSYKGWTKMHFFFSCLEIFTFV
jgi:hypothetical protein